MAIVTVRCLSCAPDEKGEPKSFMEYEVKDFGQMDWPILSAHMLSAHMTHRLEVLWDGQPVPIGTISVKISCQQNGCPGFNKVEEYKVPWWFANSAIIQHHAMHEGHSTKLSLNDVEIRPLTR